MVFWYFPAPHRLQNVDPGRLISSEEQSLHAVSPGLDAKRPTAQDVQLSGLLRYVPGGHCLQNVWRVSPCVVVPFGHGSHNDFPPSSVKRAEGQDSQRSLEFRPRSVPICSNVVRIKFE